jgi:hypothetical protein
MEKSSSLGMPMSSQEISKKYKRQSLGVPKAPPSSSTKISGHLSKHYIYYIIKTTNKRWLGLNQDATMDKGRLRYAIKDA